MNQFMDRLFKRASKNKSELLIAPAFTPEILPETLKIPEQKLAKIIPKSSLPTDISPSLSLEQPMTATSDHPKVEKKPQAIVSKPESIQNKLELRVEKVYSKFSPVSQPQNKDSKTERSERPNKKTSKFDEVAFVGATSEPKKLSYDEKGTHKEETIKVAEKVEAAIPLQKGELLEDELRITPKMQKVRNEKKEGPSRNASTELISRLDALVPNRLEQAQIRPVILPEEKFVTSSFNQEIAAREKPTKLEVENLEPALTISIGRIEVRAIMPEKETYKEFRPALSLEDYLKRRQEGTL